MATHSRGKRLSIFIGEYDRYHHHSLADAILERAREEGLAGATVMRGIEGFGPSGRLKTTRLLSSSDDLPIMIEIVDEDHRIEMFIPILDSMIQEGLVTVEEVDIHLYRDADAHPLDDDQPRS
jgi:PII-like signaling protein